MERLKTAEDIIKNHLEVEEDRGEQWISLRILFSVLNRRQWYGEWFTYHMKNFKEGTDFFITREPNKTNPKKFKESIWVSMDMGIYIILKTKSISLLSKQIEQYFLQLEKKYSKLVKTVENT